MVDRNLSAFTKSLMRMGSRKGDPDRPVSLWREKDNLNGLPEETAVVIFRTTGCSWYRFSSCTMCGYFNDIDPGVTKENLIKQIDYVKESIGNTKALKVFTSGSFLDPLEFPIDAREYFFSVLQDTVDKFLVESRNEYITRKNLENVSSYGKRIRIAIGLESSNDLIIERSVNKGSSFSKFREAASTVRDMGMESRAYLLFKPPFISEKAAIEDTMKSVGDAAPFVTDLSVNPMNIQKNTLVEYLWKRALYRPPRLLSVARILMESLKNGYRVVSYPTAGNRERGAHDEEQNADLLKAIYDASLTQDYRILEEILNSIDISLYLNELDIEDKQLFQSDYGRMVSRISSSSVSIA